MEIGGGGALTYAAKERFENLEGSQIYDVLQLMGERVELDGRVGEASIAFVQKGDGILLETVVIEGLSARKNTFPRFVALMSFHEKCPTVVEEG